ncbi:MAG: hypothetical protein QNK37_09945 [Acidobacteriota bacterium]|nr:hypothetical protein [Acidobacteriota bacterium]
MNKKRLKLAELTVKSFNTKLPREEEIRVQGASGNTPGICTNYYFCTMDAWSGCDEHKTLLCL